MEEESKVVRQPGVIIESGLTRPASGLLADAASSNGRMIAEAPSRRRQPKQDFRGQGDRRICGGTVELPVRELPTHVAGGSPGTKEAAGEYSPAASS
jgi:hypothetical protein